MTKLVEESFDLGMSNWRSFESSLAAYGLLRYRTYDVVARDGQLITLRFKASGLVGGSAQANAVLAKLQHP